jgi:flagellar basal-body rod protein FlgC
MNLLPAIDVTSGALSAQKMRVDVVAQNIANAHTTRGPDGTPYQRRVVQFETELLSRLGEDGKPLHGVRIGEVSPDQTPGKVVYDPAHPDADENGMVQLTNVNMAYEMVDLITATRAYEANLSVVKSAREMTMKTLQIGR